MEQLLQQILEELQRANRPSIPLGFGYPPKPRYIYANRQYPDCNWYFWNGAENKHEPISQNALTGTIEKLEIETKAFRGKPDPKMNLHIRADLPYVIQAGLETLFAKGLLFTLSKLPAQALKQPITIAVEPGETDQVLFCRIYNPATGNSVYAPYPDDTDWAAVTAKAIAKVAGAETPSAEIPTPELDGQQRLIPADNRGAADVINQAISKATTEQELKHIIGMIYAQAQSLGPMASKLVENANQRMKELDPSAIVEREMIRVGWSREQGRSFLQEAFGKSRRAELTPAEMAAFIGHLQNLPNKSLPEGDWD